jgi:hypothetical protein
MGSDNDQLFPASLSNDEMSGRCRSCGEARPALERAIEPSVARHRSLLVVSAMNDLTHASQA